MTWEDAIKKMVKQYFADKEPEEINKTFPNRKYNKKYFDGLEGEFGSKKGNDYGD